MTSQRSCQRTPEEQISYLLKRLMHQFRHQVDERLRRSSEVSFAHLVTLDQLQQEPASNTAVLLERWRERPEVVRMRALAGEEMLGLEESSAALDLVAAIETLSLEPTVRRYDELMAKGDLTEDERAELKELNVAIHRAKSKAKSAA